MKRIIKGTWTGHQMDQGKLARGLLQYRNTPSRRDGTSPAQKLFGKPIQDTLPAHHFVFNQPSQKCSKDTFDDTSTSSNQQYYNRRAHPLPEIHIGTNVAIQNPLTKQWDIYGVVTHIGPYRQYHVKLINGRVLVRNRRFIRCRVPAIPFRPSEVHVPPAEPPSPPPLRRSSRLRKQPIRYADEFASK